MDDYTTVWLTKKGITELDIMDEKSIKEKYGFAPSGIIELKALMGDSSDNIPGVAGVGEKTALSLLQKYGTLDGVYEHIGEISGKLKEKLENDKDKAYLSKTLATIKTDCEFEYDIESCTYDFPFNNEVREFFEYWNFNSFSKKEELFKEPKKEENRAERILIDNLDIVDRMKSEIRNEFAFNIKELEFAVSNKKVYFLKKDPDLFSSFIDFNEVLGKLKDVFENENILKITKSSKEDMKILHRLSINLRNFFDLEIARYVCFTSVSNKLSKNIADYFDDKKNYESMMVEKGVDFVYNNLHFPTEE